MAKSAHPSRELYHFIPTHNHQGYSLAMGADWLAIGWWCGGDWGGYLGAVKREELSLEKV